MKITKYLTIIIERDWANLQINIIIFLSLWLQQITDLLATDRSQYFAITKFNQCSFDEQKTSNQSLTAWGPVLPFSHKSAFQLHISRILFAAKHLFVGSNLQVIWWALGQWKGRKNTLNNNNIYLISTIDSNVLYIYYMIIFYLIPFSFLFF